MKRILFSLGTIAVVAAVAIGGTVAFYNDTETSTGNVFTAGSIDLQIDSLGATYNGQDAEQTGQATWESRDLTTEKFFVFDDIKPGDYGTRHISLHADSNEAWACLLLVNKDDEEREIVDPEEEAGDTSPDEGELSGELQFFAWQDNDGDGVYDPEDEEQELPVNGSTGVDSFFDVTYDVDIADSESGTEVLVPTGSAALRNIALAWCAGDQTVDHDTGEITCDGSGMSDIAQTDSFTADVVLYAEQVRNNENFRCADVELGDNGGDEPQDPPTDGGGFPDVSPI